jgi:F-type H+-transporting ATPase subunit b
MIHLLAAETIDTTPSWILPEGYEILFGGIASVLVFALLYWKAWPFAKKGLQARTARIQKELDGAVAATTSAADEAARIREAKGDITAERARLLAEADEQAAQLLIDGRARIDAEAAELEAKAEADLASFAQRSGEELRAEIARITAEAADRLVDQHLDEATHQDLVEQFIAKVGRS